MSIKKITLAFITLAAGLASMQAADAQGARFKYAPQYYKLEETRTPKSNHYSGPAHSVKSGAVPHGMSHLGIDPAMLAKKAAPSVAPIVQQSVAAIPSFTRAVPTLVHPKPNFNAHFGKPLSMNPPVIAHAPTVTPPLTAAPQALAAPKALAAKPAVHKPAVAHRATSSVSGKLKTRKAPAGNGATAVAKGLDSYGKDFGYVPGSFLPTASTGSGFTSTEVNGRIIRR